MSVVIPAKTLRPTIIVTNRTVEIEREGVNVFLTVITCGCWYVFFQTASIEIYELQRIQTLYLRDDVVHGEIMPEPGSSARGGEFAIDLPVTGDKTTKDLFFELKEAWQVARHSAQASDMALHLEEGIEGDELLQG